MKSAGHRTMQPETRHQLVVWASLMGLLAITVGTAFLRLGPWNLVINLGIAAIKALLVAIFFMHLARASVLLRIAGAVPVAILAILFVLAHGDYASRAKVPAAWQLPPRASTGR